jgi:hypothetical protein
LANTIFLNNIFVIVIRVCQINDSSHSYDWICLFLRPGCQQAAVFGPMAVNLHLVSWL